MRTVISRLVAGPIAALVAFLAGLGLEVGADLETALTQTATLLIMAIVLPVYGALHRWIDQRVNPIDAADPDTAASSAAAAKPPRGL